MIEAHALNPLAEDMNVHPALTKVETTRVVTLAMTGQATVQPMSPHLPTTLHRIETDVKNCRELRRQAPVLDEMSLRRLRASLETCSWLHLHHPDLLHSKPRTPTMVGSTLLVTQFLPDHEVCINSLYPFHPR